ncbi:MAG: YqgE/AlgH family protein [Saprospiraceae bacterium]
MAIKSPKIKSGKLILAEPFMQDPHFKRSVVFLCEHNQKNGSVGFILNKPLNAKINDMVQDFPEIDAHLYYGGPVGTDTLHYIHNVGDLLEESVPVIRGVYWGGNFEKLKFLINQQLVGPQNIRFFIGYSGWTKGQLIEELHIGSWIMAEGDPNYVFKINSNKLWKRVLDDKGNTFSVISDMPDQIIWN